MKLNLAGRIVYEFVSQISRVFNGKLFSDAQMKHITTSAVTRYLTESMPRPGGVNASEKKVIRARDYISRAENIIVDVKKEIEDENLKFVEVIEAIEEKKRLAERYVELAKTSEEQIAEFKDEMEKTLRRDLIKQTNSDNTIRQVVQIILSLLILVGGIALGYYLKE